ncbi:MAG: hypothetical protein IIA61_06370 [Candidatus Marinimicrobia bacterium]|nr:hypothetical protein [Candidatus Neomarinimicrobiota bacterium]
MKKSILNNIKDANRLAGIFGILLLFASTVVSQEIGTGWETDETDSLSEINKLKKQVEVLQEQLERQYSSDEQYTVDLSGDEVLLFEEEPISHVLARPWFQNIDISGFGAANFLGTGAAGTRPNGGFQVKEATLFVEAEAWEDATFFVEIQTNRLGADESKYIRTGEVYAQFRNVLKKWGDDLLGIKVGRIDIPFGEEYLWQDASDNPLITQSASFPYGWDEGVLMYGKALGVSWIAALTDGTDDRSIEDHPSKALNAKVSVNPWEALYLSASFMKNGKAAKSAMEFGGSHFQPVGASHESSAGKSTSDLVDATLYELNAKYKFGKFGEKGYVAIFYGQAFQDDRDDSFDRDFRWFSVEPLYRITSKIYAVIRYSEIGTYDSDKGYHFDGKTTAGGNSAFGYDTKLFSRFSFGLGWSPNPRVRVKVEVGRDWFDVIDSSPLNPDDDDRDLFGIELVSTF